MNKYSREQQIIQGNANAAEHIKELQKQNVKLDDFNPLMYERALNIMQKILSVSHLRDEKWYLILIDDSEFNAAVSGGTVLFINRGAMAMHSDDEIAAIMGHEIAHVALNHVFENISHLETASIIGSQSVKREWFQTAFGHNHEIEADYYGLLYAALAGYNPYAAPELWNKKLHEYGDGGFMRSHPANSERMQLTKNAAKKWYPYYTAGRQNPDFAKILESQKEQNPSDFLDIGKGGGIAGCAETYINAKQQHESAKAEELRQKNQQAAAVAKANFVNQISKLISVNEMRAISPTAIQVNLTYSGNKSVQVNMISTLLEIKTDSKPSKGILNPKPGSLWAPSYNVILEFDSPVFSGWNYGEEIPSNYVNRNIKIRIIDAQLKNS